MSSDKKQETNSEEQKNLSEVADNSPSTQANSIEASESSDTAEPQKPSAESVSEINADESASKEESTSSDVADEAAEPKVTAVQEDSVNQANPTNPTEETASQEKEADSEPVSESVPAEEAKAETQADESTQDEAASDIESTDDVKDTSVEDGASDEDSKDDISFYQKLLNRAKEVVDGTDFPQISLEIDNIYFQWNEGPDVEGAGDIRKELDTLRSEFNDRKQAHYDELSKKREENLDRKKDLIKQLAEIIENKDWTATKEVGKLKGQWDSIKQVPQDQAEAIEEKFQKLLTEFDEHKVDRLVKKLQKEEENLIGKLVILDKMELLVTNFDNKDADYKELADKFEDYIKQWRKVGRVPMDKADETWERFNNVQDAFNQQRLKFDENYRKEVEKNLTRKKQLIAEAEALVDMDNLAEAARKVNKLHKQWKKTGNLPQKDENELWDRFKKATDDFNQIKSDNLDQLRDEENENYEKKLVLIKKAEELRDAEHTDWNAAHQSMQNLMKEWKDLGPVPRKKSGKIWKQFKGAMDGFYDYRRDHLKDIRSDQKDNLNKKRDIIQKIGELANHEDLAKVIDEVKELQSQFKDAGFVPIKQKNKIWKQYREACDLFYERYRSRGSDRGMERKLAAQGVSPENRKEIIDKQKQLNDLRKEVGSLQDEVNQYNDSITYFKPTKKGKGLREEIQQKIDSAQEKLAKKQAKMNKLLAEIDELQEEPED